MNCKEGENSVNYDCEMPPLYDISISDMVKYKYIYIFKNQRWVSSPQAF